MGPKREFMVRKLYWHFFLAFISNWLLNLQSLKEQNDKDIDMMFGIKFDNEKKSKHPESPK